jgi:hypothetical protein
MNEVTKKRTRVNIVNAVTKDMVYALPNVKTHHPDMQVLMHPEMCVIVYNCAIENPTWTLTVMHDSRVTATCNGEHLAHIDRAYSGRTHARTNKLYTVRSVNNNTAKYFSHKEPAQILRKIRQFVYPETLAEKSCVPMRDMRAAMHSLVGTAQHAVQYSKRVISEAALEFALSPQGRAAFLQYEATIGAPTKRGTAQKMEIVTEKEQEVKDLEELRISAGTTSATLFRDKTGWLVMLDNKTSHYADDELPEEFGGVNILKLAPLGTVLVGIGIQAEENSYIVVPSTRQEEQNT